MYIGALYPQSTRVLIRPMSRVYAVLLAWSIPCAWRLQAFTYSSRVSGVYTVCKPYLWRGVGVLWCTYADYIAVCRRSVCACYGVPYGVVYVGYPSACAWGYAYRYVYERSVCVYIWRRLCVLWRMCTYDNVLWRGIYVRYGRPIKPHTLRHHYR